MIIDAIVQAKEKNSVKRTGTKNLSEKKDGLSRSIVKSISWRAVGTIDTIIISWFVTANLLWPSLLVLWS